MMQVHFFEEFPSRENLRKAKHLGACKIFVAAKSYADFRRHALALRNINPHIDTIYWPVLKRSYWISPFSCSAELRRLIREIKEEKPDSILFDLELPLLRPSLFLRNLGMALWNRNLVHMLYRVALRNGTHVYTAEYPAPGSWTFWLYRTLGISYPVRYHHTRIIMFYSSMFGMVLRKRIAKFLPRYDNVMIGLGVIAPGYLTKRLLSPAQLARDLRLCRELGRDAVVYRLGGINEEYLKILRQ